MDKKTLLLKYLDNELTDLEKDRVEILLEKDQEAKQILEEIKSTKQIVLKQLGHLEPTENIIIPEWEEKKASLPSKVKPIYRILKWAAILIIPVAIYFLVKETMEQWNNRTMEQNISELSEKQTNNPQKILFPEQFDLDWAISPNRNWTKKHLIQIEIITKSM